MLRATKSAGWESFDIDFDYYWAVLENMHDPLAPEPKLGKGMGFGSLVALSDSISASGRAWIED